MKRHHVVRLSRLDAGAKPPLAAGSSHTLKLQWSEIRQILMTTMAVSAPRSDTAGDGERAGLGSCAVRSTPITITARLHSLSQILTLYRRR